MGNFHVLRRQLRFNIKRILYLLVLFLLPMPVMAIPAWVSSPPSDTAETVFGIGVGDTFNSAKTSALADLAGKINTKVKESVESQMVQTAMDVDSYFKVSSQLQVDPTNLSHFQVLKSSEEGTAFWVLVQLDKKAMAIELSRRWDRLNTSNRNAMDELERQSDIERLIQAHVLLDQVKRLQLLLAQLGYADQSAETRTHFDRYQSYINKINEIRANGRVVLVSMPDDTPITNLFAGILSARGLHVLRVGENQAQPDSLIQLFIEHTESQDDRNAYVSIITLTVVTMGKNQQLGSNTYTVSARSYDGFDDALKKSLHALKFKMNNRNLSEILNINIAS